MRLIVAFPLILLAAGCDNGGVVDTAIQQGARQSAIEACKAWMPQSEIAAAAGLDGDRLCGCAADRILDGKGVGDLAELRPDGPAARAAIAQCVAQIQKESE